MREKIDLRPEDFTVGQLATLSVQLTVITMKQAELAKRVQAVADSELKAQQKEMCRLIEDFRDYLTFFIRENWRIKREERENGRKKSRVYPAHMVWKAARKK